MAHSAKSLLENPSMSSEAIDTIHSAKTLAEDSVSKPMYNSAKSAYRNSWIAENLDRINLTMPKGKKEQVKTVADRLGMSLNAYINLAVDERMEKDT